MPFSPRLAEVLGEPSGVLAGWSGNKISNRVAVRGGNLSTATCLRIKSGKWGEVDSVRQVGWGFAPELLAAWGEEIQGWAKLAPEVGNEEQERSAAEWLVSLVDSRPVSPAEAAFVSETRALQLIESALERQSGAEILIQGIVALQEKYGRPVRLCFEDGYNGVTPEEARLELRNLEESMAREEQRAQDRR